MPLETADELALVDRIYVSNFATPTIGARIYSGGELADADADVTYTIFNEASETVATGPADHPSVGTYEVTLASTTTAKPGLYLIYWDYLLDGAAQVQETYIEVGQRSPTYDALTEKMRSVVENVYWRFADLFDSPLGGPHLQVYLQTNFGRERMAQALRTALGRLNVISAPHQTFVLDPSQGGKEFPVDAWGGVLEQACYVEVLKHLRRSYVEQPTVEGVNLARFDRRDYMSRWGDILTDEQADLDKMLDQFKMAYMGLGSVSALVAGGVYVQLAPSRVVGSMAARPYYWRMWH